MVKLITGSEDAFLFRKIPFASVDKLSSLRSSQSSKALSSQDYCSAFLFVRIGFKTISLSVNLYPRHTDLMVSDSPNCCRDPALFYRPVKMFPGRETAIVDLLAHCSTKTHDLFQSGDKTEGEMWTELNIEPLPQNNIIPLWLVIYSFICNVCFCR